jgi:hypothetical protein
LSLNKKAKGKGEKTMGTDKSQSPYINDFETFHRKMDRRVQQQAETDRENAKQHAEDMARINKMSKRGSPERSRSGATRRHGLPDLLRSP